MLVHCLALSILISQAAPTSSTTLGPKISAPVNDGTPVEGSKVLRTVKPVVPGSATEFLISSVKDLEKIVDGMDALKGAALKEREAKLRKVVSHLLDVTRLGQRAMITHWEKLGATAKGKKQREKYMGLFRQLVEENYMEQARKYIGGNYTIILTEESSGVEGATLVNGRIKKPDVDVIVEFLTYRNDSRWHVGDVKLDSTSLEGTYRSSFNRIIKKKGGLDSGFPELLATMQKRLAELKKGKAAQL